MEFNSPDGKAAAFCLSLAAILMATDIAVSHQLIVFVPLVIAIGLTSVRWLRRLTDDIDRSSPYAHLRRIDTGRWFLAHATGFATYLMVAITMGLLLLGSLAPQDPLAATPGGHLLLLAVIAIAALIGGWVADLTGHLVTSRLTSA